MKKFIIPGIILVELLMLGGCGPTAEERAKKHQLEEELSPNLVQLIGANYKADRSNLEVYLVDGDTILVATTGSSAIAILKK